jgi:hypothetical protein
MPTLIIASRITPLLQLFYVLLVDYLESGKNKPDSDTTLEINALAKDIIPVWEKALPSLREGLMQIQRGRNKEAVYQRLGEEIKALMEGAKNDQEVPFEDLELFKAFGAFFRTQSESAISKLVKFASASESPWVVQRLAPTATDQASTRKQLETLVQGLVGRKDSALTLDEAKQLSETNPEEYKAYLLLRRAFNQSWKDALVSYIRKSGKDKVPYTDALNYLKMNGIDHLMSTGFDGFIDDRSRLYTNKGKMIDGMPNAVTFPTIVMNPTYGKPDGGDWVFRADRKDGGRGPTYYTSDFKKDTAQKKFKKVADLTGKIDGMRKRWFANVRKFEPTSAKDVVSVVLEILYEFSARIGSVGNKAAGQSTYGVATLLVKHAIIDPSGNITLKYKGKDGVATTHKLLKSDNDQRFVIHALDILLTNKEPNERIFTVETAGGKKRPITSTEVNGYFKAVGGGETTVHKLRTVKGTHIFTTLMNDLLNSNKRPKTEKEALAALKKMSEAVGKALNHVRRMAGTTKVTGTTALANYISPEVQIFFFRQLGFRIPKFLEKFDAQG